MEERGEPAYRAGQVWAGAARGVTGYSEMTNLPGQLRGDLEYEVPFSTLDLEREATARDGTVKALFRTGDGHPVEAVLMRYRNGRRSLCLSSQSGCPLTCTFCATGQMGLAVNLGCAEILDQIIQANRQLRAERRSVRNVVFMGMGEPLLNEAEVYQSLDVLLSPQCFNLSPARVLISTVGIPDAMVRCAERFPRLGMALSLHSARQAQRESLIPWARRYPLERLRKAIAKVTVLQRQPLMVEYLLLDGLNSADYPQMAAGALVIAALAVLSDLLLAGVARMVVPTGCRLYSWIW